MKPRTENISGLTGDFKSQAKNWMLIAFIFPIMSFLFVSISTKFTYPFTNVWQRNDGLENGKRPQLPSAWSATVLWSPITNGYPLPGTIKMTSRTLYFSVHTAEDKKIEIWQSISSHEMTIVTYDENVQKNTSWYFRCNKRQINPQVLSEKSGVEFAGVKNTLDPWTQKHKKVSVWRANGGTHTQSSNIFDFDCNGNEPIRFDFVQPDEEWCWSSDFSSVHFLKFRAMSESEENDLQSKFEKHIQDYNQNKIKKGLKRLTKLIFPHSDLLTKTYSMPGLKELTILSSTEGLDIKVPSWPETMFMEGWFTSNSGYLFHTKVMYSLPSLLIFSRFEHSELSHSIRQTHNMTYIKFDKFGSCHVLAGLGLPKKDWTTTTCKVKAIYNHRLHMAVCEFAPGRHLHYWFIPMNSTSTGSGGMDYQPVQFLESRAPYTEGASLAVADYTFAEARNDFTEEEWKGFQIPLDCKQQELTGKVQNVFHMMDKKHADFMSRGHYTTLDIV